MKKLLLSLLMTGLFFQFSTKIFSGQGENNEKPVLYIGIGGGYNDVMHNGQLATFVNNPYMPFFMNERVSGYFYGLSMEYNINHILNFNSSIIAKLSFQSLPGKLFSLGSAYPAIYENGQGRTNIVVFTEHNAKITFNLYSFELLFKITIPKTDLGLILGPEFSFVVNNNFHQTYDITKPENVKFSDLTEYGDPAGKDIHVASRSYIVNDGKIPGSKDSYIRMKAGIQYEFMLGDFKIIPALAIYLNQINFSNDYDWKISNLFQAGIDLKYGIF